MNMIEKVARAIRDSFNSNDIDCYPIARAAIKAMRETPDVAYDNYKCDKLWREMNSREVFNLWIDVALKE